jgi:uncharacterized membrane protein YgcG
MFRTQLPRLLVVSALALLALSAAVARPAAAATPCWKALLTDWYDGRIDNTYQLHCYTDALKHLPPDVRTYSSAHDDILRALQSARAKLRQAGHKVTPVTLLPPANSPSSSGGSTTTTAAGGGSSGGGSGGGTTTTPTDSGGTGHQDAKGLQGLADKLNPSSPSSLPVPLLVLGGLALLLVAAGAIGVVAKRVQDRRDG